MPKHKPLELTPQGSPACSVAKQLGIKAFFVQQADEPTGDGESKRPALWLVDAGDGLILMDFMPAKDYSLCVLSMIFSSAKPFIEKGTDGDHMFLIEQLLPINTLNT